MRRQLTALLAATLGISLAGFATAQTMSASATAPPTKTSTKTATADKKRPPHATHRVSKAAQRRAVEYWTPERMRSAQPADLIKLTPKQLRSASRAPAGDAGPKVVHPSKRPAKATTGSAGSAEAGATNARRRTNGERWGHPRSPVAKTTGKLFFRTGGKRWVCSAGTVGGKRNNVIATAGHCLHHHKTRRWVNKLLYVPGYRNGKTPYGTYPGRKMFVPGKWKNKKRFRFDVGFARLGRHNGRHVIYRVGAQGIVFGSKGTPWAHAFGYPSTPPRYHGKFLIHCKNPTRWWHKRRRHYLMRCKMNGGSSGGPWLRHFRKGWGRQFTIVSFVNVRTRAGGPLHIRGPYYGRVALKVYKWAERRR